MRALIVLVTATVAAWAAAPAPAQSVPIVYMDCRYPADDEILQLVCGRLRRDVVVLGEAHGVEFRWWPDPGHATWLVTVELQANRPHSAFGRKEVRGLVTGNLPGGGAEDRTWERGFEAAGVPRDLVHPVADAVADSLDRYLSELTARLP